MNFSDIFLFKSWEPLQNVYILVAYKIPKNSCVRKVQMHGLDSKDYKLRGTRHKYVHCLICPYQCE